MFELLKNSLYNKLGMEYISYLPPLDNLYSSKIRLPTVSKKLGNLRIIGM